MNDVTTESTIKTIGILGGMGPLATADLFRKIILRTDASSDRDHIHVFIDSNTSIPDRTEFILGRGPSPLSEMVKSAIKLEMMGADIIVMPCNTAHYFYDDIKKYIKADFINMIEETASEIMNSGKNVKTALLATEGTCAAGVYDKVFAKKGMEMLKPEKEMQDIVTSVIYNVKKGLFDKYAGNLEKVINAMKKKGAELFILGCTELPLYFETLGIMEIIADPTDILARCAVKKSGKKVISSAL